MVAEKAISYAAGDTDRDSAEPSWRSTVNTLTEVDMEVLIWQEAVSRPTRTSKSEWHLILRKASRKKAAAKRKQSELPGLRSTRKLEAERKESRQQKGPLRRPQKNLRPVHLNRRQQNAPRQLRKAGRPEEKTLTN